MVLRAGDLGGKPPITFPQKPALLEMGTRIMDHDTLHKKYMVNSYILLLHFSSYDEIKKFHRPDKMSLFSSPFVTCFQTYHTDTHIY